MSNSYKKCLLNIWDFVVLKAVFVTGNFTANIVSTIFCQFIQRPVLIKIWVGWDHVNRPPTSTFMYLFQDRTWISIALCRSLVVINDLR